MERTNVGYARSSPTPRRRRVLLLDEDDFALEALELVLQREGFEVSPTTLAHDALELIELWTPEICVVASGLRASRPSIVFEACARLVPRCVRVLLAPSAKAAAPTRSGRPRARPHIVMDRRDALTDLAGALEAALRGDRPGDGANASDAARILAERIATATARGWPEDVEHCRRVAAWSRRLASALGLSPSRALDVELGAMLHDVGVIHLPDDLLRRPSPQGDRERRLIREHPTRGAELLAGMPLVERAIPVVLCHHERRDGGGYPRGLRGSAIPLEARVFQVIDCYEALVVGRPWRDAIDHEEAVSILRENRGTQLDPEVVDVFVTLRRSEWSRRAA